VSPLSVESLARATQPRGREREPAPIHARMIVEPEETPC
jgi:hypothetical protein